MQAHKRKEYETSRISHTCSVIVMQMILSVINYIHTFIHCKPRGFYGTIVVQEITLKTQVHDSDATLACHIARFDAIDTSCGSATP